MDIDLKPVDDLLRQHGWRIEYGGEPRVLYVCQSVASPEQVRLGYDNREQLMQQVRELVAADAFGLEIIRQRFTLNRLIEERARVDGLIATRELYIRELCAQDLLANVPSYLGGLNWWIDCSAAGSVILTASLGLDSRLFQRSDLRGRITVEGIDLRISRVIPVPIERPGPFKCVAGHVEMGVPQDSIERLAAFMRKHNLLHNINFGNFDAHMRVTDPNGKYALQIADIRRRFAC